MTAYMSAPANCVYANSTQKDGSRRLLDMDMGTDNVGCGFLWTCGINTAVWRDAHCEGNKDKV